MIKGSLNALFLCKIDFSVQKKSEKNFGQFFALKVFINYYELYYLLKRLLSLLFQSDQTDADEGI